VGRFGAGHAARAGHEDVRDSPETVAFPPTIFFVVVFTRF
jgi:hypothetical protein